MEIYMIIKGLSLLVQLGLPIVEFFIRNAQRKDEMKKKMYEFMEKHNDNILENPRLRKDYLELKERLKNDMGK